MLPSQAGSISQIVMTSALCGVCECILRALRADALGLF
jgi:hypothetical protein